MLNVKISRCRTVSILISLYRRISVKNKPILIKFCVLKHMWHFKNHVTEAPKFLNSRWRKDALLENIVLAKTIFRPIGLNQQRILQFARNVIQRRKIRPTWQIEQTLNFKNSRWRTASILKIVASTYFSQSDPTLMAFRVLKQYGTETKILWTKSENGGRTPYWKYIFRSYLHSALSNFLHFCTGSQKQSK